MAELTIEVKATEMDIFREIAKELVFLRFFYKEMNVLFEGACEGVYKSYCGELPEGY